MAENTIELLALEVENIDTTCYLGTAPLEQLTRISEADVYDQDLNPQGLQRELTLKHAKEAYEYVAKPADPKLPRAYTEVVLNVRDKAIVKVERKALGIEQHGKQIQVARITVDLDKIEKAKTVKVSRLDGNHRLLFGAGDRKEREPLSAHVPFQIHIGLTPDQEASLFSDINANQKGLNTSHLAIIETRVTPEDVELERHPERVFARRLAEDVSSPWHGLVHMGGSKAGAKEANVYRPANFIAVEHGVKRILKKSQYLAELEHDAQYGLIRSYWQAVKAVFPEAFDEPRKWLVLKNLGVATFSQLAGTVIDRCYIAGNVDVDHMVPFLLAAKGQVNWHADSPDVAGMSGNRAVLLLVKAMSKELPKTADVMLDPSKVEAEQRAAAVESDPQVEGSGATEERELAGAAAEST
jgi:DGQHR domain-containing protein